VQINKNRSQYKINAGENKPKFNQYQVENQSNMENTLKNQDLMMILLKGTNISKDNHYDNENNAKDNNFNMLYEDYDNEMQYTGPTKQTVDYQGGEYNILLIQMISVTYLKGLHLLPIHFEAADKQI
jgi:hypothetical protein